MMAYMDSGFKKFTSIHDRLALQLSKCLKKESLSQGKITLFHKKKPERNSPKQLKTDNVFTYVEHIDHTY